MDNNKFLNSNSKYLLITNNVTNKANRSNLINIDTFDTNNIDANVFNLVNDKSIINNNAIYELDNLIGKKNITKHKTTSTKEWATSVYSFNKNSTGNLVIANSIANKLLTSYINKFSLIANKKANSYVMLEKKNTLNKTLVSESEVKITNDKVNLTVYIYNRNKKTILRHLKKTLKRSSKEERKLTTKANTINRDKTKKSINRKTKAILKLYSNYMNRIKLHIKKKMNRLETNNYLLYNKENTKELSHKHLQAKLDSNIIMKYFANYLNTFYVKKMLSLYYIREIVINNSKFKNWSLLSLKNTLSKLYNKKVELNIVNQKYFYLNSDIFVQALATRVRDRNNRIIHEMNKAVSNIPLARIIPGFNSYPILKKKSGLNIINNFLKLNIFSQVRYKHIQGVRIEAAGRLTQRLTAARALSKVKSKGNLKNTRKLELNQNFALNRGNVKPNIQYTILNAKTRNGAFGLKGWVNSN